MKKKFLAFSFSLVILFSLGAFQVFAQNPDCPGVADTDPCPGETVRIRLENPFRGDADLLTLLKNIINNVILPIGGVLCVLAFIYSGFLFVKAQGNTSELKTARTALLNTAIGTAVLLGSWVLANAIYNTIRQFQV